MPYSRHDTAIAVAAEGLEKRFPIFGWVPTRPRGYVEALRGLDLVVREGEIHGVIGANGAGKSTLLRILATLIIADVGRAQVLGHDVVEDELAVRRSIGFTTGEERSNYWRLTARQNLEFVAALQHVRVVDAAIDAALELTGLKHAADRPVSGFSQGMARRLGLARAVLHSPDVLLLDEPTRSLDPVARDEFHQVLTQRRDRSGTTTVLTTHDLAEAAALCDTVTVVHGGRAIATLPAPTERKLRNALQKAAQ
jgi:ABC-2 type transport system ATP-binding protein